MAGAHDHAHDHAGHEHAHAGHGHAGHTHAPSADADHRWLTVALALIAGFMGVEIAAGLLAGSLALLSDAAHMLTDAGSIALALVAARFAARPAVAAFAALSRSERQSMNVAGARAHVLADLYGSLAAIIAGVVIASGGPTQVDALAALSVAGLMLRSGWSLLRDSARVLLEAAPHGIDPDGGGMALASQRGV